MGDNIGNVIDAPHHFHWVDEEGDAPRHSSPLMTGWTHNPVRSADHTVDIGKERERKLVLIRESLVGCWVVERRSENHGPQLGEQWASITEALAFNRSTRCVSPREPPEHKPRLTMVVKRHQIAVLIG